MKQTEFSEIRKLCTIHGVSDCLEISKEELKVGMDILWLKTINYGKGRIEPSIQKNRIKQIRGLKMQIQHHIHSYLFWVGIDNAKYVVNPNYH